MKLVIKIGIKIVFLCVFCFLFEGTLSAQVFPASATVRILPPYNTFIRELAQAGNERLQVILLQRDLATPSYQVRLKFKVFLDGNLLFETKPSYIAPIITIEGGIPTLLSGADLSGYFDAQNLVFTGMSQQTYLSSGNVPEGAYQFCATVFDAFVPTKVLSNAACQSFFMVRSEPPLLNMPACGTAVLPNTLLTFRWNNVSSAGNWEYKLELFEIRNADGNPNNAVLSNNPIFTNTSTLNNYVYTPVDPPLLPNMRYAWRVQAVDLNGINQVRNNGNSLVCDFTNQPQTAAGTTITAISAPLGIQAEAKSPTAGRVFWTPYAITPETPLSDKPDSYHVEYKKVGSGFEWFKSSTSINDYVVVTDLEPSTGYQARMQAKKGTFFSDYSAIVNFTTPAVPEIKCGDTPRTLLGSQVPYLGAMSGDRIKIDGFTLVLDSLVEGEGGVYGGDGLISVEFLAGKQFEVYFEGLFINELKEGGDGKVWFKMRDMDAWIQEMTGTDVVAQAAAAAQAQAQANYADIDLDPNVLTYPGYTITNVSVNAQGVITLTTSQGAITVQASDLPNPRVLPIIIEDKDGQQWVVSPEGVVTAVPSGGLPPKYAYSDDKLEASDSLHVIFTEVGAQLYGYDTKKQFKWSKNYEIILLKNNRNYFVPYQSVATNAANGKIIANLKLINRPFKAGVAATDSTLAIPAVPAFNYDISKVSFKSENGTVLRAVAFSSPTSGFHTTYTVDIPAIDVGSRSMKETFIYAYYETKKIGKINITALKKKEEKVILVPVAGAVLPDASAIQTYLNGIYKGANVVFTVETKGNFVFDLGANGTPGLERSDESVFGKYSLEMRALKSAYMAFDANYDKKASYIFVVPSFSGTGDLKGFMVRGRSVGFVVPDADMRTYAHELGHGVFGLEHTFPEIAVSTTNNLMDYGTGTHLTHEQWKIIHARKPAYNWFDSEEDGGSFQANINLEKFRNTDNTTVSFLTPGGNIISIPYKRVVNFMIEYGAANTSDYQVLKNISGSLIGFRLKDTLDNKKTIIYTYNNGQYLDSLVNSYKDETNFDFTKVDGFVYPLNCEGGSSFNKFRLGGLPKYTGTESVDNTQTIPEVIVQAPISLWVGPTAPSSPPPLKFAENIDFLIASNVKLFTSQPIIAGVSTSFSPPKDCYWCTSQTTLDMNTPYKGSHLYLYVDKIAQIRNVYPEYFKKFTSQGADWLFPFAEIADKMASRGSPNGTPPLSSPNFLDKPWLKHIALQYVALGGSSSIMQFINEDYTIAKNRFVDQEALILKFLRDFNAFVENSNVAHTNFWENFSNTTPLASLVTQVLDNETNFNLGNVAIDKKQNAIRRLLDESSILPVGPLFYLDAKAQSAVIRLIGAAKTKEQADAILTTIVGFIRTNPPSGGLGSGVKFIWDTFSSEKHTTAIILIDALVRFTNKVYIDPTKIDEILAYNRNAGLPNPFIQAEADLLDFSNTLTTNYQFDAWNGITIKNKVYGYNHIVFLQAAGDFNLENTQFKKGELIECTALMACLIDKNNTNTVVEKGIYVSLDIANCALSLGVGGGLRLLVTANRLLNATQQTRRIFLMGDLLGSSINIFVNVIDNGVINQDIKGLLQLTSSAISLTSLFRSLSNVKNILTQIDDELAYLRGATQTSKHTDAIRDLLSIRGLLAQRLAISGVDDAMGQGIAMYAGGGASAAQLLPNLRKYNHIDPSAPSIIKAKMGGQDPNNIVDMLQHQATPNYQNAQALITSGQVSLIDTKTTILAIDATVNSGAASTKIANNWTNLCTDLSSQSPTRNLSTIIEGYAVNNTAALSQRLKDGQAVLGTARTYQGLSAGQPFYFVTFAAQITNAATQTVQAAQVLLGQTGVIPQAGTQTQTQTACQVCPITPPRTTPRVLTPATCQALQQLRNSTNNQLGINALCNKISSEPTLKEVTDQLNTYQTSLTANVIANDFLNDVRLIGQPTRHISSNLNSNFGIEQVKAWKKLHTSGFETDFEYIRTLSFKQTYIGNNDYEMDMTNCSVSGIITGSFTNPGGFTLTHGTFITTFSKDSISAKGGTGGGISKANRNQLLNVIPLIPNFRYNVTDSNDSPYVTYFTDAQGRVREIRANLHIGPSKRDNSLSSLTAQSTGPKDGRGTPADNGGHMIRAEFDGPVELINYFAQDAQVNQSGGDWFKMEDEWSRVRRGLAVVDNNTTPPTVLIPAITGGKSVSVNIKPHFPSTTGKRPDWFDVEYKYGGVPQNASNNVNFLSPILNP